MKTKYILSILLIIVLAIVCFILVSPSENMCYECENVLNGICYSENSQFYGCNMEEMMCSEKYKALADFYLAIF